MKTAAAKHLLLPAAVFAFCAFSAAQAGPVFRRVIERVASLDPIEATSVYAGRCVALSYETLLEYDYEARPYRLRPCLATAMPEISEDGLVYTFRLNTNACFIADKCFGEKGTRPVTAADFIYSFKRIADAKLPSTCYWLIDGRVEGIDAFHEASKAAEPTDYAAGISGLRALADDVLQIRLTAPSPVFLWMMAMPNTAAVPHEAVEFYGDNFREHPVGSGPYYLADWKRNYKMTYRQNPHWRGWAAAAIPGSVGTQPPAPSPQNLEPRTQNPEPAGAPFETLVFPLIDDPSTQWLAFLSGELDIQGEVARDNWDQVIMPDGSLNPELNARGIALSAAPTLEVAYIGINMDDPVLGKNRKLRQALNAAFDAKRWEDYCRGRAVTSNGPVPPQVAGAITNDLPYGRGLDIAKKLLEEAGYPGGRDPATGKRLRLTLDLGKTTQDIRESTELMVAFMERCGIELVPEYNNWPAFLKKVSQRRSQLFRIAWVGDYPDAENFLQLFYGPNASPGPNRCNYSNPDFDSLYREAMLTTDEARRLELYGEMQKIIQEDSPWVFVSFAKSASLSHKSLLNYLPSDFSYGNEKYFRTDKTR